MLLRTEAVTQAIDGGVHARFLKDILQVEGDEPLAIVRKRRPPADLEHGRYRAAVLLTHGFGQNRYAWHLSERSFANYLAHDGFDVYNLDLRGHGRSRRLGSRGTPSVDGYIREDLPGAIAEVLRISGQRRAFLVGHSLGALVSCATAAAAPEHVAGIVALGPPYRFARGSNTLQLFSQVVELLADAGLLRGGRGAIPVRWVGRYLRWYRHAWDTRFLPIPVRAWHPGAFEPRVLIEYLRQTFDSATFGTLQQMTRLAVRDEFRSSDGTEDYGAAIEASDVPLLVIAGAHDMLAPPASVRPLYDRSHAHDKSYRVLPLGHADLVLGRHAPQLMWPLVRAWLREHAVGLDG